MKSECVHHGGFLLKYALCDDAHEDAAVVVVVGVRLCLAAKRLPVGGGPAAPARETPDRAERQRPRAQTQTSGCC